MQDSSAQLDDFATPGSAHAAGCKVLYLSYDGMCDQLGASQVLPYLAGLSRRGHRISLISFEKPQRSADERAAVARVCAEAGISWHPLPYHRNPPVVSSMYDVHRMYRQARHLHRRQCFDLLHCRSYLPALAGLWMKRKLGVPFIFDMRGFWADERVEGGIWNPANPLIRAVYTYFKRREADFLAEADHLVSLTEAGTNVLLGWRADAREGPPISLIPCCVDFEAFPPVSADARMAARRLLGIAAGTRVAAYLGSFGSWYMVDEMLDFFRVQLERNADAVFLVISREPPAGILVAARARGIPDERVIVRAASRSEVPKLVAAADYGLFFIKPLFSKVASSPTKMGEFLALELSIVTNGGVGDVARIMKEANAGVVVDGFDQDSYRKALDALDRVAPDMERWRKIARSWFDLDRGIDQYDRIYRSLIRPEAANGYASRGKSDA